MWFESAIFGLISFYLLWILSVAGAIAVWLSWIYVEREYDEEGLLTRSSRCSVRSRLLLTASCIVFWICLLLEYALTDSPFGFLENHPLLLIALFYFTDILLIAAVLFAWQSRGSGRWILWIATPIIAVTSIVGSIVLSLP